MQNRLRANQNKSLRGQNKQSSILPPSIGGSVRRAAQDGEDYMNHNAKSKQSRKNTSSRNFNTISPKHDNYMNKMNSKSNSNSKRNNKLNESGQYSQ